MKLLLNLLTHFCLVHIIPYALSKGDGCDVPCSTLECNFQCYNQFHDSNCPANSCIADTEGIFLSNGRAHHNGSLSFFDIQSVKGENPSSDRVNVSIVSSAIPY